MTDSIHALPQFAARGYGVVVIAAPLLMLASTLAYITAGDGINQGVLGGVVGIWAVFAMAIAMLAVLRLLEPRAPRAATLLTMLAVTGFAAGVAFNLEAALTALMGPELDTAIDAAIAGPDAVLIFAFLPWGWFAPLSLILVGAFLWRTRTTAWWNGALLIAGGVLFVVSRMERIGALALVADGVLIAALVPIGWAMVTGARTKEPASAGAR